MVDFQLIGQTAIGVGILALIAIVGANWSAIVSTVSAWWGASLDRARQQKAARDRLYGYAAEPVLADPRTSSWGGSPSSGDLVPGQQHQVEPQEPDNGEPDEKWTARQLAREELIITLAVQRKENGDYLWSANQITAFVGGAAAPIKSTIANVRGKKEVPPPGAPLRRPANGW